jgi:hypothetical protein
MPFLNKPWPTASSEQPRQEVKEVPSFVAAVLPPVVVEEPASDDPPPMTPEALEDLRMRVANKGSYTEEELKRGIATLRANRKSAMSSVKKEKAPKAPRAKKGTSRGMNANELEALLGI